VERGELNAHNGEVRPTQPVFRGIRREFVQASVRKRGSANWPGAEHVRELAQFRGAQLNLQLDFALHLEPLAQTTKAVGLYQCEVGFTDAF
jgi:hypothetical protein